MASIENGNTPGQRAFTTQVEQFNSRLLDVSNDMAEGLANHAKTVLIAAKDTIVEQAANEMKAFADNNDQLVRDALNDFAGTSDQTLRDIRQANETQLERIEGTLDAIETNTKKLSQKRDVELHLLTTQGNQLINMATKFEGTIDLIEKKAQSVKDYRSDAIFSSFDGSILAGHLNDGLKELNSNVSNALQRISSNDSALEQVIAAASQLSALSAASGRPRRRKRRRSDGQCHSVHGRSYYFSGSDLWCSAI